MSFERKSRIQNHLQLSSPQQFNSDFSGKASDQQQNQDTPQFNSLKKMDLKISKVLSEIRKLQEANKKKDEIIRELENQNLMLKRRIVSITQQADSRVTKIKSTNESSQPHILQRTFTPKDLKKGQQFIEQIHNQNQPQKQKLPLYIDKQYNSQKASYRKLKQNRSLDHLNKLKDAFNPVDLSNKKLNRQYQNEQQIKIRSYNDTFNPLYSQVQDKSQFINKSNELREKINQLDTEKAENYKVRGTYFNKLNSPRNSSSSLLAFKSCQNFFRQQAFQKNPRKSEELQALKKLWAQRDQEMNKINQLFSKIDRKFHSNHK